MFKCKQISPAVHVPRFLVVSLLATLASTAASKADDPTKAEIETVPQKMHPAQPSPVWVADGQTEYSVKVTLSNEDLNPEKTDTAQWSFINSPGFDFISAELPTSNDFFEGITMEPGYNFAAPPGQLSARKVDDRGTGPINKAGELATYKFSLPLGTTPDFYSFNFGGGTKILDDGFPIPNEQPLEIINHDVWVAPINPADFHNPPEIERDGYINQQDAFFYMNNMNGPGYTSPADIDGNGEADVHDLGRLQRCFTGDQPVSSPNCE